MRENMQYFVYTLPYVLLVPPSSLPLVPLFSLCCPPFILFMTEKEFWEVSLAYFTYIYFSTSDIIILFVVAK